MKTKFTLLALMLSFNFQLLTFNSSAQSNQTGAGNCLQFNGTSNWINISNAASLNFGIDDFSVEFWINSNYINNNAVLLSKRDDGCSNGQLWSVLRITNQLRFHINIPGGASQDIYLSNVFDGSWHHIAFIRNQNGLEGYRDGVFESFLPVSPMNVSNAASLRISNDACPWGFFVGQLDEVRIWKRALTQNQIKDNMCQKLIGNEAGMVGYWRFDEITGNIAFDSSPNGNNGTGF